MQEKEKNKIGVIGGMGPYAAIDFCKLILQLSPSTKENELPIVHLINDPTLPSRNRAFLYEERSPADDIKEIFLQLRQLGCNLAVLPCNSAHYFVSAEIIPDGLQFVNIVDVTLEKILSLGVSSVSIFGAEIATGSGLYKDKFEDSDLLVNFPNKEQFKIIRKAIDAVKENADLTISSLEISLLVEQKKKEGVEIIIFACTELQALNLKPPLQDFIVDSTAEYAKKVVDLYYS